MKKKLTPDKYRLVTDNLNLVRHIIHTKLHVTYNDSNYDDYFQIGCLALVKAAIGYDSTNNTKFATYAFRAVYNDLIFQRFKLNNSVSYTRSIMSIMNPVLSMHNDGKSEEDICSELNITSDQYNLVFEYFRNPISTSSEVSEVDGNSENISISDMLKDNNSNILDVLNNEVYYNIETELPIIIDKLTFKSDRHKEIFKLHLISNLSQRKIADKLNCSQSYVSRVIKRYSSELKDDIISHIDNILY